MVMQSTYSIDLCYIAGALRDSSLKVREGKDYELTVLQKDARWLYMLRDKLAALYGNGGRVYIEKRGERVYNVLRIFDKKVVMNIRDTIGITSRQVLWATPRFLKNADKKCIKAYIQGFFDAEGGLPRNPAAKNQIYISFDQKNKEPLIFIREQLIKLNYKPTQITYTHGTYQFRITRKQDIIRFIHQINSLHPEKRARLNKILEILS